MNFNLESGVSVDLSFSLFFKMSVIPKDGIEFRVGLLCCCAPLAEFSLARFEDYDCFEMYVRLRSGTFVSRLFIRS